MLCGHRDETIYYIISEFNTKKSIRLETTGWASGSTGNFARKWNLTIRTSCICTSQPPSRRMKRLSYLVFWDTSGSHNLGQTTKPYNNKQKKYRTVDLVILADHRVKLKESEKYKYLDLAREVKKLWNLKAMFIPIVIGALATATNGLMMGLEEL